MENMDNWIKAGRIAAEAREYARTLVKKNARILEIADKIEGKIKELGGETGFPVNISMNETAAHDTAAYNDERVLTNEVVKIDIGVCYEGAIGDTAFTVDLSGNYTELVKASEEALNNAIKIIKPKVTLGEIGKVIQETISSYGFTPVRNLCGHGLELYKVHSAPSIPNYDTKDKTELEKGQTIAIEPFATTGVGMIKESGIPLIYSEISKKPVRDTVTRNILKEIEKFNSLPFTTRWLCSNVSINRVNLSIRQLMLNQNLRQYPPLVEVQKGIVSQAEHSLIVDDKPIVTTE